MTTRLRKHFLPVTLPKIIGAVLVFGVGIAERSVAFMGVAYVVWMGAGILDRGWHEQYIQPANKQAARLMTDIVDSHSIWPNDNGETRKQAIERLVTPYLRGKK